MSIYIYFIIYIYFFILVTNIYYILINGSTMLVRTGYQIGYPNCKKGNFLACTVQ
nr:MAG TPA_asm: hypothetical protein [Caudoviricetes sp.]